MRAALNAGGARMLTPPFCVQSGTRIQFALPVGPLRMEKHVCTVAGDLGRVEGCDCAYHAGQEHVEHFSRRDPSLAREAAT